MWHTGLSAGTAAPSANPPQPAPLLLQLTSLPFSSKRPPRISRETTESQCRTCARQHDGQMVSEYHLQDRSSELTVSHKHAINGRMLTAKIKSDKQPNQIWKKSITFYMEGIEENLAVMGCIVPSLTKK